MRSNSAARSNASEMWRYSATLGSTAESSSYPLSTTACRRARVTESLLANNVTSQPRATSPSVMLLATVSPGAILPGRRSPSYRRQDSHSFVGLSHAVRRYFLVHGSQHFIEGNGSETGGVVGHAVGNDQFAVVEESATSINDVRHVAFTLLLIRFEQGFAEASDHFAGIIVIEEERADAVRSQGADTVAEDQPARFGLNGGPAVPKLDQLPGEHRFKEHLAFIPEVDVVGKHEVDVLVVLAGEHGIEAVDFPGEDGHAFVFRGRTVQSDEPKEEEVRSLHQLWQDHLAIEGREGGIVDVGSVIVLETDEPGVFDTVAL